MALSLPSVAGCGKLRPAVRRSSPLSRFLVAAREQKTAYPVRIRRVFGHAQDVPVHVPTQHRRATVNIFVGARVGRIHAQAHSVIHHAVAVVGESDVKAIFDREKDWRDIAELVFAVGHELDADWIGSWLERIVGREGERHRRCMDSLSAAI